MRARRPGVHVSMYLLNHSDIDVMLVDGGLLVRGHDHRVEAKDKEVSSWPVGNTSIQELMGWRRSPRAMMKAK